MFLQHYGRDRHWGISADQRIVSQSRPGAPAIAICTGCLAVDTGARIQGRIPQYILKRTQRILLLVLFVAVFLRRLAMLLRELQLPRYATSHQLPYVIFTPNDFAALRHACCFRLDPGQVLGASQGSAAAISITMICWCAYWAVWKVSLATQHT